MRRVRWFLFRRELPPYPPFRWLLCFRVRKRHKMRKCAAASFKSRRCNDVSYVATCGCTQQTVGYLQLKARNDAMGGKMLLRSSWSAMEDGSQVLGGIIAVSGKSCFGRKSHKKRPRWNHPTKLCSLPPLAMAAARSPLPPPPPPP